MSSNQLDVLIETDPVELVRTYKRLRQNWSKEFALELVRMYRSINYLREDQEKLKKELQRLDIQLARLEDTLEN